MTTTQTFTYETDSLPLLQETLENMLPVLYGRTSRFYLSRNKHGFNEAEYYIGRTRMGSRRPRPIRKDSCTSAQSEKTLLKNSPKTKLLKQNSA